MGYKPGHVFGRGDIDVFFQDDKGKADDPESVSYAVWFRDSESDVMVLVGANDRKPVRAKRGEYHASFTVPPESPPGEYVVRWIVVQGAETYAMDHDFELVSDDADEIPIVEA